MGTRDTFARRLLTSFEETPRRIPILVGGCGTGRTDVLLNLRSSLGSDRCQYVDLERTASTPERFLRTLTSHTPFGAPIRFRAGTTSSARAAFDSVMAFLTTATTPHGGPATFLLDEVLEIRTFENFPGLRSVVSDLVHALDESRNQFVLTTRYIRRARRLLKDAPERVQLLPLLPLLEDDVLESLNGHQPSSPLIAEDLARTIHCLADGRPAYVQAIVNAMFALDGVHGVDPISALVSLFGPGGALYARCRFSYELRLHRARGYGALMAILDVLSEEEPLTLTVIAQRLNRTPGSTKDYLSWLEDVDLITATKKRYSFADPLLRLWVRLYCRAFPPSEDEVAREVHAYAMSRLPAGKPGTRPLAAAAEGGRGRAWGIIEID